MVIKCETCGEEISYCPHCGARLAYKGTHDDIQSKLIPEVTQRVGRLSIIMNPPEIEYNYDYNHVIGKVEDARGTL